MSTASEETSPDQPQRTSHQPGSLAILAATAIGGAVAARMGKTPLLFAAGAAAMAMLRQKKPASPPVQTRPQSLPPTAPPAEIPAQSQVEQWLSRQISREAQAPFVDIFTAGVTPTEPEDDYRPESFLLDDVDDISCPPPPDNEVFATLTEPPPQPLQELSPEIEEFEEEPEAPPPPQVLQQTPPAPLVAADAAWTLGVDPMPSLNETEPYADPAGSMFFSTPGGQETPNDKPESPTSNLFSTAPLQHEDLGPPPFFSTTVFQGAPFPDEIQVAPGSDPALLPPFPSPSSEVASQEPEFEPVTEPLPTAKTSPEITLELAAPGEASFDPPLASAPQNPWKLEPDVFAMTSASPVQTLKTSTVVEAEIILRPRAPTQNAVLAKSKFSPPGFGKHFSAEGSAPTAAEGGNDAHFPGPLQSQQDPKPRPTWRSWWSGD